MRAVDTESSSLPVAVYLRNERLGLRAPVREDAAHAGAWYEGTFPVTPQVAEDLLVEQETTPWGNNPTIRLMVIDLETGGVVGGALVERTDNRVSKLRITVGAANRSDDERQQTRADVLRILLPWVMDELDLMIATIDVAADESTVIDTASEIGMNEVVRLREYVARPNGRVDLLMFERVNLSWGRGGAGHDA
jgi:RimJ/RimL family protein N-acetyltransferase